MIYSASIMHALGVPDRYIMERGGWSTDKTLKAVYQHTMSDQAQEFNKRIKSHFEKMQHEMQRNEQKPHFRVVHRVPMMGLEPIHPYR